jgi:hypothetical protein
MDAWAHISKQVLGRFDPRTGPYPHRPDRVAGYRKRACMFFDVVHRHSRPIDEWLLYLRV